MLPLAMKMAALDLKQLHADDDAISMVSTSVGSTGGGSLGKQPCNICGTLWRWSKMHSLQLWEEAEDNWGDSAYNWHYRCANCVKEVEGLETLQQAWDWIFEHNGTAAKKKAKLEAYVKAKEEMKETFDALGVSKTKREITQVTRVSMCQIFELISDLLHSNFCEE